MAKNVDGVHMSALITRKEQRFAGVVDSGPVLTACCDVEAPALIISPILASMGHGRFTSFSQSTVTFKLLDEVLFRPLSMCCVSFAIEQRAHIFMSTIRRCSSGSLELYRPNHITAAELRGTFRIPVSGKNWVTAEVDAKGWTECAEVVDISLNGIGLELPAGVPSPSVDDVLSIDLTVDGDSVRLRAVVRNVRGNQCGLLFPECMRGTQVDPPHEYRQLVEQLELAYLRER